MKSIHIKKFYPHWLEATEKGNPVQLFDVRTPQEYSAGHVPGATLIALNTLTARANEIPKDGDVFVICQVGGRSAQAIMFLSQQFGYDNLINLEGGTGVWMQSGYPVERG